MSKDFLTVGAILAPHGVRGDIRIKPLTERPERFLEAPSINIKGLGKIKIQNARWHKQFILLKLEGVDSMDDADKLRGLEIIVEKSELGKLPEGRYYAFEIIGMDVYNPQGELLGVVSDILTTGAADVYAVKQIDGKELLLPAIKEVVLEIDINNKKMVVQPQEWA